MSSRDVREVLDGLIAEAGVDLGSMTPRGALDLILRWYGDIGGGCLFASWGNVARYGEQEELGFKFT